MKFTKFFAALLLMFVSYADMWAQVKMNAYSQMVLNTVKDPAVANSRLKSLAVKTDGTQKVLGAFIEVDDPSVLDELRTKGVMLEFTCGDVTTASIPVSIIDDVLATKGLASIQFERTVQKKNDKARQYTNVNNIHSGTGLDSPYKGKGVIYGTVDGGMDFNHAAFKDAEGNSRILMAYLPDEKTPMPGGVSNYTIQTTDDGKTYHNDKLPGYIYSTEYIKNITTGDNDDTHGTHTAATGAGGTYGSSTFYGMAPEASLILTDLKILSNKNILNGVALAFHEATQRQMPAVVNLSLGSNKGSHDDSDSFNKALNNLCGEGKIIVTSAGNEAGNDMCLQKEENVTISSCIAAKDNQDKPIWNALNGGIEMWGKDGKPYTLKISLLNSTNSTVTTIYDSNSTPTIKLNNATHPGILSGTIDVNNADPSNTPNGNRNINIFIENLKLSNEYKLAIELSGESYVNVWGDEDDIYFVAPDGFSGYTAGNDRATYSSIACYDNAISVGSMNSSNSFTWAGDGKSYKRYESTELGEMSGFSSYGTDPDGRVHPTVVAPGNYVSSAFNSYHSKCKLTNDQSDNITQYDEKDGRIQPYGISSGTSMAAPVVAGIIALWLEKHPHLTPTDVKNIIAMTAVTNDKLQKKAGQMGANGMIDAYAGIKSITTDVIDVIANGNDVVVSPSYDGFMVLAPGTKDNALVEVFTTAGTLVLSDRIPCNTARHFSLPASSTGIYLVSVTVGGKRITKKLGYLPVGIKK